MSRLVANGAGLTRSLVDLGEAIGTRQELKAESGTIRFVPGAAFKQVVGDALRGPTPLHRLTASSNSISLIGERLFLKAYRRIHPGINPELEMGRFLNTLVLDELKHRPTAHLKNFAAQYAIQYAKTTPAAEPAARP